MVGQVIYLTGAPASGKSSLGKALSARVPELAVFEYGAELTAFVRKKTQETLSQESIRAQSSAIVTPEDVAAVDEQLVEFVRKERRTRHVLIDSHAVTRESYGYRVTPYSLEKFAILSPTSIWVLYASPELTVSRIRANAQGRPMITEEEARFHTNLQASVATTYGMSLGVPVHLFESSGPVDDLARDLSLRLSGNS